MTPHSQPLPMEPSPQGGLRPNGLFLMTGDPGCGKTDALLERAVQAISQKITSPHKTYILAITQRHQESLTTAMTIRLGGKAHCSMPEVMTWSRFILRWLSQWEGMLFPLTPQGRSALRFISEEDARRVLGRLLESIHTRGLSEDPTLNIPDTLKPGVIPLSHLSRKAMVILRVMGQELPSPSSTLWPTIQTLHHQLFDGILDNKTLEQHLTQPFQWKPFYLALWTQFSRQTIGNGQMTLQQGMALANHLLKRLHGGSEHEENLEYSPLGALSPENRDALLKALIIHPVEALYLDEAQDVPQPLGQFLEKLSQTSLVVCAGQWAFSAREATPAQDGKKGATHPQNSWFLTQLEALPQDHVEKCLSVNPKTPWLLQLLGHPSAEPQGAIGPSNAPPLNEQIEFGYFATWEEEVRGVAHWLHQQSAKYPWGDMAVIVGSQKAKERWAQGLNRFRIPSSVALGDTTISTLRRIILTCLSMFEAMHKASEESLDQADWASAPSGFSISEPNLSVYTAFTRWAEVSPRWKQLALQYPDLVHYQELDLEAQGSPLVLDLLGSLRWANGNLQESLNPFTHLQKGFLAYQDLITKALEPASSALSALLWAIFEASGCFLSSGSGDLDPDSLAQLRRAVGRFLKDVEAMESLFQATGFRPLGLDDLMDTLDHLGGSYSHENTVDSVHYPEDTPEDLKKDRSCIHILTLHEAQGCEFPVVLLPSLVHGSMPVPWQGLHSHNHSEMSLQWLAQGLCQGRDKILLSVFKDDPDAASGAVWVLAGYRKALSLFRQYTTPQEGETQDFSYAICWCETAKDGPSQNETLPCQVQLCHRSLNTNPQGHNTPSSVPEEDVDFLPLTKPWPLLPPAEPDALYTPEEPLYLSASSIDRFMKCPRAFYYGSLLRLPQVGSERANMGQVVHGVMETYHKRQTADPTQYPHQRDTLLTIVEEVFGYVDRAVTVGKVGDKVREKVQDEAEADPPPADFPDRVLGRLMAMDPLSRFQLHQRLNAAIIDLEAEGYFNHPIQRAIPEFRFKELSLEGIPNVLWTGSIDALLQRDTGRWSLIDYKVYNHQKFNQQKAEFREGELNLALEPIALDVPHAIKFKKPLLLQLPLYAMIIEQEYPQFQPIASVALQLIRPPSPDKEGVGAIEIPLNLARFRERVEFIKQDIVNHLVSPIRDASALAPNPSRQNCENCSFVWVCDAAQTDQEEEQGQEEAPKENGPSQTSEGDTP